MNDPAHPRDEQPFLDVTDFTEQEIGFLRKDLEAADAMIRAHAVTGSDPFPDRSIRIGNLVLGFQTIADDSTGDWRMIAASMIRDAASGAMRMITDAEDRRSHAEMRRAAARRASLVLQAKGHDVTDTWIVCGMRTGASRIVDVEVVGSGTRDVPLLPPVLEDDEREALLRNIAPGMILMQIRRDHVMRVWLKNPLSLPLDLDLHPDPVDTLRAIASFERDLAAVRARQEEAGCSGTSGVSC